MTDLRFVGGFSGATQPIGRIEVETTTVVVDVVDIIVVSIMFVPIVIVDGDNVMDVNI